MMMLHAIQPEIPERFLLCALGVRYRGFYRTWRVINGQLHINRRTTDRVPTWEPYSDMDIDRWARRARGLMPGDLEAAREMFI